MSDDVACFLTLGRNVLMHQAEMICDLFVEHEFLDKDEILEIFIDEGTVSAEEVKSGHLNEAIKEYLVSQGITFCWSNDQGYSTPERVYVYCAETETHYRYPTIEGEVVVKYSDINNAELISEISRFLDICKSKFTTTHSVAITGHEQVALAVEQQELAANRAALR